MMSNELLMNNEPLEVIMPPEEMQPCRARCEKILAILDESHVIMEEINGPYASGEKPDMGVTCSLDQVLKALEAIEQSSINLHKKLAQMNGKI